MRTAMEELARFLQLLWGTVVYRPYVYAFFACFLIFSLRQLKLRGTLIYMGFAHVVAFLSEYNSTQGNGFPFGLYRYFDATRARELWIAGVPFWDSLSFVFLSYFSWRLAGYLRWRSTEGNPWLQASTALLSGLLMMLLDVVIDPLTLLGDQWFLGSVYDYPNGGSYFGVTLSNFMGWFFVGAAIPAILQLLVRSRILDPKAWRPPSTWERAGIFAVYSGILLFNLTITAWIRQWALFGASGLVTTLVLGSCLARIGRLSSFKSIRGISI